MTKLGITRLPGESEDDFRRRYCREKMRLYRATKPKSARKRGKGKGPARNGQFTPEEWAALQQRPGEPDDEYRRRYNRERARIRRRRAGVLDRQAELSRAKYASDPEHRDRERQRKLANPEAAKAYGRAHFERNREARMAILLAWRANNPERLAAAVARHRAANPGLYASYSAKWRAAARVATPPWADHDAIKAFYDQAARLTADTGVPHQVDHIVPLQGKTVCGLHVQTNLRVITARANSKKRNRLDAELIAVLDVDVI